MRIYFDSSPVIYFVENLTPWKELIEARIVPGTNIAISDLTKLEVRIKPIRSKNITLLNEFEQFFQVCQCIPLTSAVFDRATQIRADYGFKTPDAIHLAAAVESGCHRFLTNDHRLSRFPDIVIDVV